VNWLRRLWCAETLTMSGKDDWLCFYPGMLVRTGSQTRMVVYVSRISNTVTTWPTYRWTIHILWSRFLFWARILPRGMSLRKKNELRRKVLAEMRGGS
jgi:hypothetical protein